MTTSSESQGTTKAPQKTTAKQSQIEQQEDVVNANEKHEKRQATASPNDEVNGDTLSDPSSNTAEEESPKPMAKKRTLCGVCHSEAAKYKCPRCSIAYCSVSCSKTHNKNHPPPSADDANKTVPTPAPSQNDESKNNNNNATSRSNPFSVLDDAPELARLFSRYPNLPTRLRSIYDATLPPKEGESNMPSNRPPWMTNSNGRGGRGRGGRGGRSGRGGRGGRDHRGGRGGYNDHNDSSSGGALQEPWTREKGLRQGQKALRMARTDPSEDGDGVREYCELVLYLLSPSGRPAAAQNSRSGEDVDATAMVRQEVAQDDIALVQRLLDAQDRR